MYAYLSCYAYFFGYYRANRNIVKLATEIIKRLNK